jgi:hypothetical protein
VEASNKGMKRCPFCGESIRRSANTCRFYNEMLTGLRSGEPAIAAQAARPAPRQKQESFLLRALTGVGVFAVVWLNESIDGIDPV